MSERGNTRKAPKSVDLTAINSILQEEKFVWKPDIKTIYIPPVPPGVKPTDHVKTAGVQVNVYTACKDFEKNQQTRWESVDNKKKFLTFSRDVALEEPAYKNIQSKLTAKYEEFKTLALEDGAKKYGAEATSEIIKHYEQRKFSKQCLFGEGKTKYVTIDFFERWCSILGFAEIIESVGVLHPKYIEDMIEILRAVMTKTEFLGVMLAMPGYYVSIAMYDNTCESGLYSVIDSNGSTCYKQDDLFALIRNKYKQVKSMLFLFGENKKNPIVPCDCEAVRRMKGSAIVPFVPKAPASPVAPPAPPAPPAPAPAAASAAPPAPKAKKGKYTSKTQTYNVTNTQNLIISLKRFEYERGSMKKISQPIFPDKSITINGVKFQLEGCIRHIGSTPQSGHYIYQVYHDGAQRMIISDESISTATDETTGILSQGYVFFYKRVGGPKSNVGPPSLVEYCPLFNNNNRCYMNSAIQLLYSIPGLRDALDAIDKDDIRTFTKDDANPNCKVFNVEKGKIIVRCLKLLFDTFETNVEEETIDTRALKIDGVSVYDHFVKAADLEPNAQEDTSEFIGHILNAFECFNVPQLKEFYTSISFIPIETYKCESGKTVDRPQQPLTLITLPIVKDAATIQLLLDADRLPKIPDEDDSMVEFCAE